MAKSRPPDPAHPASCRVSSSAAPHVASRAASSVSARSFEPQRRGRDAIDTQTFLREDEAKGWFGTAILSLTLVIAVGFAVWALFENGLALQRPASGPVSGPVPSTSAGFQPWQTADELHQKYGSISVSNAESENRY